MEWGFVLAVVTITVGLTVFIGVKLRALRRSVERCRGWMPVIGRVMATEILEVRIHDVGPQYIPIVRYRYVVGGVESTGERLTVGPEVQYSRRRNAERRLVGYDVGHPAPVLFDPAHPEEAVLECRAPLSATLWWLLALAWIVLIGGLALMLTPGIDGPKPMLRLDG